ncbi:MAG TPA: hypothetical protein VNC50_21670, partial [Planctomycetia bacterium]|nr:hypothetical protein [Planctomycetia bacterium]
MANAIGLDLAGDTVHFAALDGFAAEPRVRQAWSTRWPVELTLANAAQLGAWLKDEFRKHDLAPREIACNLGRGLANFKNIEVPDVPAADLPPVIAFAVEPELVAPSVVDYQLGDLCGGQREVVVGIVTQKILDALAAVFAAAGVECRRLGFRPYGFHFFRERLGGAAAACELLVAPVPEGVELSLWCAGRLELTRAIPRNGDDLALRTAAEVRRTLMAFHSRKDVPVDGAVLLAPPSSPLVASLAGVLDRPPVCLDPAAFAGFSEHAAETGAVGVAWRMLAGVAPPINFLDPKKPPPPTHNRKRIASLAAAFAALLVVAGYFRHQSILSELDGKISEIQAAAAAADKDLKSGDPAKKRHEDLSKWVSGRVDWLAEFTELAEDLPDTSLAFATSMVANTGAKESSVKLALRTKPYGGRNDFIQMMLDNLEFNPRYSVTQGVSTPGDFTDFALMTDFFVSIVDAPKEGAKNGKGGKVDPKAKRPPPPPLVAAGKQRVPVGFGSKKAAVAVADARRGGPVRGAEA